MQIWTWLAAAQRRVEKKRAPRRGPLFKFYKGGAALVVAVERDGAAVFALFPGDLRDSAGFCRFYGSGAAFAMLHIVESLVDDRALIPQSRCADELQVLAATCQHGIGHLAIGASIVERLGVNKSVQNADAAHAFAVHVTLSRLATR